MKLSNKRNLWLTTFAVTITCLSMYIMQKHLVLPSSLIEVVAIDWKRQGEAKIEWVENANHVDHILFAYR